MFKDRTQSEGIVAALVRENDQALSEYEERTSQTNGGQRQKKTAHMARMRAARKVKRLLEKDR